MRQFRKKMKKSPGSKFTDKEICDLNDKEFNIAVLKKLSKMQVNTDKQFNDLRSQINKQDEYFNKEIDTFKKNQTDLACAQLVGVLPHTAKDFRFDSQSGHIPGLWV